NWTLAHARWLAERKMPTTLQQIVLEESIQAVREATARVERLTAQIGEAGRSSRAFSTQIQSYQALRGVSTLVATTVAAELGDLRRFHHPSQLMAFTGLVPSESS